MIVEDEKVHSTEKQVKDEVTLRPFTVEILNAIKEAQQQHGLRHSDYQRYRGYCSRRIARLRKVLKLPQGERRHFKRRDVQEAHINHARADERYLHLPLMLAERNWAYAMQLRQEANTEPRKKFHLVRKLRKACHYAMQLEELCKLERCDVRTKLEAQAYVAWLNGTLHFELHHWPVAADNLKQATVLYEKLASALPDDQQLHYRQRIDELAPSLRYCAYNVGDTPDHDHATVNLTALRAHGLLQDFDDFVRAQSRTEPTTVVLHEIDWYGMRVTVRSERVQLLLQSLRDLDASLQTADATQSIEMLEKMFIDLRDVIALVRDDAAKSNNQQQMALLLNYLLAIRIERTIERNLYLIQQTRKPQDIIRLLEINLQQQNELAQLEPLAGNAAVGERVERMCAAYRALRSFYIARALGALRRWREAYAVFERALTHARASLEGGALPVQLARMLEMVVAEVPYERTVIKATAVFEGEEQEEEEAAAALEAQSLELLTKREPRAEVLPLAERMDEYHENGEYVSRSPNIVRCPPRMEPIPAKPLFYDLAYNFVKFPDLTSKLDEEGGSKKQGGISGFVKGLWGWGGGSGSKD